MRGWFVVVAGVAAAVLALIVGIIARNAGQDVNLWLTVGTALVVGMFIALLWAAPRDEGFTVKDEGPEIEATMEMDEKRR